MLEYAYHTLMNKEMYRCVFTFLRIETMDANEILAKNYLKFEDVQPESIGINEYFTLNSNNVLEKEIEITRKSM